MLAKPFKSGSAKPKTPDQCNRRAIGKRIVKAGEIVPAGVCTVEPKRTLFWAAVATARAGLRCLVGMSLFPKRVKRGGRLIVHTRYRAPDLVVAYLRTLVEDPTGHRHVLDERELVYFPKASQAGGPSIDAENSVFAATPPAIFAEYLSQTEAGVPLLLDFFEGCERSTHRYLSYQLPADALPGRYHVHLETVTEGNFARSTTSEFDHFYLDLIEVLGLVKGEKENLLVVRNASPAETPVDLVEISDGLNPSMRRQGLALAPLSTTEIPVRSRKACLSYLDNTEVIRASVDREPFVQRNLRYRFRDDQERRQTYVSSVTGEAPMALILRGNARDIWLGASGFITKPELGSLSESREYAILRSDGLISEIA